MSSSIVLKDAGILFGKYSNQNSTLLTKTKLYEKSKLLFKTLNDL
jgi:hypothetical protein